MRIWQKAIVITVLLSFGKPALAQRALTERFQNREVVSQEIIVRFRGAANAEALSQSIRNQDSDIASSSPIGRAGAIRLRSRNRDVAALLQAYARRSDVEYAEPNYLWRATDIPNDSFFGDQWALRNTGQFFLQSGMVGADIKANEAWDVAEGSKGIVVGMIDSGIEYTHPDLADNMWSAPSSFSVTISGQTINCGVGTHGFNAITRTCDPTDDDGHGTQTAGIVGARGNSGVGVSGVSRIANIMALKFLDDSGQGTTANAIAAIEFAIQVKKKFPATANVRILNASWSGGAFSQALLDEIKLAGANDMLFVTSAGNVSQNNDSSPEYPASYTADNIIAVAATDNRDRLASFSNFGAATVHLGAPGVDILSTSRGKFYTRQTGTSASAPMVSGAAALVLSACALNTASLKSNILGSVDLVPGMSGVTVTGGRLNANTAIRNCAGSVPPTFTLGVTPAAQTIAFGTGDQFSVSVNPLNGFTETLTLSASNLPAGMSVSFSPNTLSSGVATLTVVVSPEVSQGTYFIGISAAAGAIGRNAGIAVTVGVPSACSVDMNTGRVTGMLTATDAASLHRAPAFADFCTFTLDAERAINIEMSAGFNSPFIYLLSNSGQVLATGTPVGSSSKIVAELAAGTYTIEATSSSPGLAGIYDLYVRYTSPTITSISPTSAMAGSSVNVTIIGTAFVGAPFLVKVSSCVGVTVSNVNVMNSTTASATLALPGTVATCAISVSTPGGSTSTLSFRIFPPPPVITGVSPNLGIQGQTVNITLTGTNFVPLVSVFLADPSPLNTGLQFIPSTVTSTTISIVWTIGANSLPGEHRFRVQTEGGTSNQQLFTINVAPPSLSLVFPSSTGRGMSVDLNLQGLGFTVPVQVDAGPDIAVSNVTVVDFSIIRATFTAAPNAAFGDHPVTVTTALGTSATKIFRVLPPPTITSFTPANAFLGRTRFIQVTGTNFGCPMQATIDGTGVSAITFPSPCTETSAGINLSVDSNAPLGLRNITLTGTNGAANPITINIVPVPGFIDIISPPYGVQGSSVTVTLTGRDIVDGTVNVSGGGVVATTLSSTNTSVVVSLTIAANAAIGPRDLSLTNAKGTTDPMTFTVTPPTWPDLTVKLAVPPLLGSGWDETFVVTIQNVGTKETTSPITVKHDFGQKKPPFSFTGEGWTCTVAQNRFLTCTSSNSIGVGSESSFSFVMTMTDGTGGFSIGMEVSSPEDYNTSNNGAGATSTIVGEPGPKIVVSNGNLDPGQQGTISLVMSSVFPHDLIDPLNNVVTISFVPSVAGTPTDSALQFATGGQRVSYTVKANTLSPEIQGIIGPIGFQAGTAAGSITFTATHRTKMGKTITVKAVVNVNRRAPTITAVTPTKGVAGFDTAITMFSSTREVSTLTFRFNTPVQLSCGGMLACDASGSTIAFNVVPLFNTWYGTNTNYGTVALVRVPFNVQGTLSGTVTVTMTNMMGISNSMNFAIP